MFHKGLGLATKIDPETREKEEFRVWLTVSTRNHLKVCGSKYCISYKSKHKKVGVLPIWIVKCNISSVLALHLFLSDEGPMLQTLDFTIRIDSTPTFLYFDFYILSLSLQYTTNAVLNFTATSPITRHLLCFNLCSLLEHFSYWFVVFLIFWIKTTELDFVLFQ